MYVYWYYAEDAVSLNEVFSSDVVRPLSNNEEVVAEVTTYYVSLLVISGKSKCECLLFPTLCIFTFPSEYILL